MTVHYLTGAASVPDMKRIDECKGCLAIDEIEEETDTCLACALAMSLAVIARRTPKSVQREGES